MLQRHFAGMRPRVIAKELQVTTKFISNTIELLKRNARQILRNQGGSDSPEMRSAGPALHNNPVVLDCIQQCFKE